MPAARLNADFHGGAVGRADAENPRQAAPFARSRVLSLVHVRVRACVCVFSSHVNVGCVPYGSLPLSSSVACRRFVVRFSRCSRWPAELPRLRHSSGASTDGPVAAPPQNASVPSRAAPPRPRLLAAPGLFPLLQFAFSGMLYEQVYTVCGFHKCICFLFACLILKRVCVLKLASSTGYDTSEMHSAHGECAVLVTVALRGAPLCGGLKFLSSRQGKDTRFVSSLGQKSGNFNQLIRACFSGLSALCVCGCGGAGTPVTLHPAQWGSCRTPRPWLSHSRTVSRELLERPLHSVSEEDAQPDWVRLFWWE